MSSILLAATNAHNVPIDIQRSLSFNGTNSKIDYINGDTIEASIWRSRLTFAAWVKFGSINSNASIFTARRNQSNITNRFRVLKNSNNKIMVEQKQASSSVGYVTSATSIASTSQWYHICVTMGYDTTPSERLKVYINGARETLSGADDQYPPLSSDGTSLLAHEVFTKNRVHTLGAQSGLIPSSESQDYFHGLMAHVYVLPEVFTPQAFGFGSGTSFKPKEFNPRTGAFNYTSGSYDAYGVNGAFLKFEDTNNLGKDSGSQGNDFSLHNVSSSTDTPT